MLCLSGAAVAAAPDAPLIVAHRGGTGDMPENTLQAFAVALDNGADALWMTVQLTRDGVPVLYRPADLSAHTDGQGPVSAHTAAQIARLDAGHAFRIPTLRAALRAIPENVPLFLDLKQRPVAPLVQAVAQVLDDTHAWARVRLYSTDAQALALMRGHAQARVFESRDATRDRLVRLALGGECIDPPAPGSWVGIELNRELEVVEHFTLGAGVSRVQAHWWTPAAVQCFRSRGAVHIVAFGVDAYADYAIAAGLGMDAVMTDSPRSLRRRSVSTRFAHCPLLRAHPAAQMRIAARFTQR